jgi:hypothetical protein
MGNANDYSLESLYQEAWERQRRQKQETFIALNAVEMMPYYIVPGSRKGKRWMQTYSLAQLVSLLGKCLACCVHTLHITFVFYKSFYKGVINTKSFCTCRCCR